MSEVHLASSVEGPEGAPAIVLANPIGTRRAIWDAQARVLREDYRLLTGRTALAGRDDGVRHRGLQAPGHPRHLAPGSVPDTRSGHCGYPQSPGGP